jgi:formylglycine-generating enzyme required for sulfatase activity
MFGKKNTLAETGEDRIRLKPVLGIQPALYLAGIYGLVILIILFFILIFPGLKNPGSMVRLESEPSGAAVRVDDVTIAATPCEIFVPQGRRVIELTLPGFQTLRKDAEVPGRVFASFFLPSRLSFSGTLSPVSALDALTFGASDFAAWSFTGEPTAAYQIPLSLSEGVYRSAPAARSGPVREEMEGIIEASARFAATRAAMRDLLRSRFLADNGGLSPSPLSLVDSAGAILNYLSENPGSAAWLGELLPAAAAAPLRESDWYINTIAAAAGSGQVPLPAAALGRTVNAAGLSFRELPGGELLQGAPYPHRKTISGFFIADTEITAAAWEAFLNEQPKWKRENRAALIEEGLADEEYLAPAIYPGTSAGPAAAGEGSSPDASVSGVSWYAARACCEWLTGRLPPDLAAWEARLPTEAEWEYAAKFIPSNSMIGGLWEWCGDPYTPLNFLDAPAAATEKVSSPERSLRGGSWVNNPGLISAETRASLSPDSSGAFVSFRPVIARKAGSRP